MADNTKIQWCNATWNPIAGCTRVGTDCTRCYAERMANRLQAMGREGYQGTVDKNGRWTGGVNIIDSAFDKPYHWRRSRRIFVNSMSDFCHDGVPDDVRFRLMGIMRHCPHHTFIVLTKRPDALAETFARYTDALPPNVEWGVSVGDEKTAQERLPHLVGIKREMTRIVSYEPAIGPWRPDPWIESLDGIIAGGESGFNARPDNSQWYRVVRDCCVKHDVPFFFKQWSSAYGKPKHRLLDGEEWNQFARRKG